MKISIIVAISKNFIIGCNNQLPWNIPKDLCWFKKHTIKKSVIMGRKTWNSIGYALPMRQNIVLTKTKQQLNKNVYYSNSLKHAIKLAKYKKEIMIIGGSSVYKQTLPFTKKIYLTKIDKYIHGDVYFPKLNPLEWKIIFIKKNKCKKNNFNYTFQILKKF